MAQIDLKRERRQGFTLLETIGVLAVIAVLAALLLPRIFEAMDRARINQVVVGCHTIKTAVLQHYANYGEIASVKGVSVPLSALGHFDHVLLAEGLIDKPFAVLVGDRTSTNTTIRVLAATDGATAYDLDGDGHDDTTHGQYLVEAVIAGVNRSDAIAINEALDGAAEFLGANPGGNDNRGRVIYKMPHPKTSADVRIYLTHR